MDLIGELGYLALASRLKRLGELLQAQVSEVYAEQTVNFRARWFPVLVTLGRTSPLSIVQLAAILGLTHTAVAQIAQEMEGQGLLGSRPDPRDGRRRMLGLTPEGEALTERLGPLWEEVRAATAELVTESGHDLLGALAAVEEKLAARSMADRLRARIAVDLDLEKENPS